MIEPSRRLTGAGFATIAVRLLGICLYMWLWVNTWPVHVAMGEHMACTCGYG